MARYFIKRILLLIPVLLGVMLIVFFLLTLAPTDPAALALGVGATDADRHSWREEKGLNDSFIIQYLRYCKGIFTFDFGRSYFTNRSIGDELASRLPNTALLSLFALCVGEAVGIPIGVYSAVRQYSLADNLFMVIAMIGISMPGFWSGIILSYVFALKLGILPPSGFYGAQYFILPTVTLALGGIANAARMTRSSMLDIIRQDFITTLRAKGVSERTVIWKHAFKNSLITILTQAGIGACTMIGGAIIVETVFSVPGIGTYMINSIKLSDYPAVLGCVAVVALLVSLILIIVDLLYAVADPRIRAKYASRRIKGGDA